ncbi:MAG TPA: chain length-determining protein [Gammaproteobacteria bacterium]|nr:chain length-determining protein [Gammaproteobacteria bacterium]
MDEIVRQFFYYLYGIWRYRWWAIGFAWAICMVGWLYVYTLPNEYQSKAQVYVDTASILKPLLQGLTVSVNPDREIQLMTRTFLSRPNLEKVARMTDLDLQASNPRELENILDDLSSRIKLIGTGRQNLYTITYNDSEPEQAKRVVQALLNIFVENTLGKNREDTESAQRFLDKQIAEYEERLMQAEERLKEFKRRNLGLMPSDGQDYFARLQAAKGDLEVARLEWQQAVKKTRTLKEKLAGETPTFGFGNMTGNAPADARIQALQERLDSLLLQYTEHHPDVQAIRRTIADIQEQARMESELSGNLELGGADANPVYQQIKIALGQSEAEEAALRVRVQEFQKRVEKLEHMVFTVPEVEAELVSLNRDYEVTYKNYQALLARREQSNISQKVGENADDIRFRVVEPPRAPLEPTGPDRRLYVVIVALAGLGSGLGLAVFLSQIWATYYDRRTLFEETEIPVLGTVSRVLNEGQIRRERVELYIYYGAAGTLLASFLVAYYLAGWVSL